MELLERDALLAELEEFRKAAFDGTGCIVFVSGEAGIGKSALANRFCAGLPAGTVVHRGFCDALRTPRALGPLYDMARSSLGELAALLDAGPDRHTLFTALLDLLAAGPSVVLVEDVHWADEATLDLLVFLARRIVELPVMVAVTYRSDDVDREHPLRRVLGDLATTRAVRRLSVPPLSLTAVTALAEARDRDGAALYAVTGGNAFFVIEALGAPTDVVPGSIRDAVLARVSRLDEAARSIVDVVSLVPVRAEIALLESRAGLDAAVRSGILDLTEQTVGFRHELARLAVEAEVPQTISRELHERILQFLIGSDGVDPARLAFHADAAGDSAAVLAYAPVAGRLAGSLGAHREAAEHYHRALRNAAGAPASTLAQLWESRADACERMHWARQLAAGEDPLTEAIAAAEQAAAFWRAAGETEREVVVTARHSHLLWNAGRRTEANAMAGTVAAEAARLPAGTAAASAFTSLARLRMLEHDEAAALAMGTAAVVAARRYGDPTTLAHALGVVGRLHWATDPDHAVDLTIQALEAAHGDDLTTATLLCNLGVGAAEVHRYESAEHWLGEAVRWCTERDLDSLRDHAVAWQARCHLEQGRWAEATRAATAAGQGQVVAVTVIGTLRSRRGDPDAQRPLDTAWALVGSSTDVRRRWPVAAARAEHAWLSGNAARIPDLVGDTYRLALEAEHPWAAGELGCWLRVADIDVAHPPWVAPPYAAQLAGDWTGAARLWRDLGRPYESLLAQADSGDQATQLAALDELQRLGAWPAAELLARQLRGAGLRTLPRRPRRSTRDNPGRLTERQLDVLALLAEELTNADIGNRLHISAKTVDHHVSAILAALGVESRRDAAEWARRTGLA